MVVQSLVELIGHTPLFDVSALVPHGAARLVAKLEMFNPGGSVKDRPALAMVEAAEKQGLLKRGMTIVEPTGGGTGLGLALVANAKGYRSAFFVPDKVCAEKICNMRLLGAEVHLIDRELGIPGCMAAAKQFMAAQGDCFMPDQFSNPANPGQAETTLGGEIREQLGGYPDGLAIGAGTGGTFTGLCRWLKAHNPQAVCWLVQPVGSVFNGGEKLPYQIEGIGNSFIPETLDLDLADEIIDIHDEEAFGLCRLLARTTGLLAAGSSGANLAAAIRLCSKLGEGKTVVTVFPDSLERYHSKDWVKALLEGGE